MSTIAHLGTRYFMVKIIAGNVTTASNLELTVIFNFPISNLLVMVVHNEYAYSTLPMFTCDLHFELMVAFAWCLLLCCA